MYVVIVYDVGVDRVDQVRKLLNMYLSWVQNSVFEGEITPSKLEEIIESVSLIIDRKRDSVIVYSVNNQSWIKKKVWGLDKSAGNVL